MMYVRLPLPLAGITFVSLSTIDGLIYQTMVVVPDSFISEEKATQLNEELKGEVFVLRSGTSCIHKLPKASAGPGLAQ